MLKTSTVGSVIESIEDWPCPKREYQWKEGRSAMELARRWFASGVAQCPPELSALLDTCTATKDLVLTEGYPEHVTTLPERGEGRNHDLMLRGTAASGEVVVCVEAKVDESFGDTVGHYIEKVNRKDKPSRLPARAKTLLHLLFGESADTEQKTWNELRYQLLTAAAGCALEAAHQHVPTAVFIVHELRIGLLNQLSVSRNDIDYKQFVAALWPQVDTPASCGSLYGPLMLRAGKTLPQDVELYIGKAVYLPVQSTVSQETLCI